MGSTPEKIAGSDPAALSEYGHLIETFTVGESLEQISWWGGPVTVGHFRTGSGDEVDLVIESDDGRVIAFEFKAEVGCIVKTCGVSASCVTASRAALDRAVAAGQGEFDNGRLAPYPGGGRGDGQFRGSMHFVG